MENDKRVVPIRKGTFVEGSKPEPNPELVKELEWLLEAARAGEIVGFAYATYNNDGTTGNRYVGYISRAEVGSLFSVMSRINKQLNEA